MITNANLITTENIQEKIQFIRGEKVLLDRDLAILYGVETKALNQAVKRNIERFPSDFMLQLTKDEFDILKSHFVTSKGRGGVRKLPYAFTEQGVAMLSSVLKSPTAIQVNIEIMRAFTSFRRILHGHSDLRRKIVRMESKYDSQFKAVFEAIKQLLEPISDKGQKIGFK